jgi:hypothetical protein
MEFHARFTIALANNRFAIGIVHAARDANAVIADLLANTFGIGGLGQHEPQRRRGHANQDFAHCFASGSFPVVNRDWVVWFRKLPYSLAD